MTAKELKASILDLAVRGKLVQQDPNDEPASVLLEKLRAEKRKLVKAGKIKKEKNPSEIYIAADGKPYEKFADGSETCIEDEIPFELPKGWAWARLDDLMIGVSTGPFGSMLHKTDYANKGVPIVNPTNLQDGKIIASDKMIVAPSAAARLSQYKLSTGMLVVARRGEMGRCAIVGDTEDGWLCGTGSFFLTPFSNLYVPYIAFIISSPYARKKFANKSIGTTMANLNHGLLKSLLVPLPPLAEQKRIVAKIERLRPLVEKVGELTDRRLQLDADQPSALKKSILQYAVEGKLVPQNPNDEPASVLVERIAEERKALVKAGKLKRDKNESIIFRGSDRLAYETRNGETMCIEDELPFKIPETWAWVRLGSVATIIRGSGIKRDEIVPVGMPCIRYGELYTTYRTRIDTIVSHTTETVASKAKSIKQGDVLLTLTGENKEDIGMAAAYLGDHEAVIGGDVAVLSNHHCDPLWLSYLLASPFAIGQKAKMSNGDIIVHLSVQSVANIMLPLPPLPEQKRIVAQIEKMLKASEALTT